MKKQVFEEENPHPAIDVLPASKRLSSAGKMFIEEDDDSYEFDDDFDEIDQLYEIYLNLL